jgi:hypothetical protein
MARQTADDGDDDFTTYDKKKKKNTTSTCRRAEVASLKRLRRAYRLMFAQKLLFIERVWSNVMYIRLRHVLTATVQ